MTAKEKSKEIFNSHYVSIMEYGEDFGQEILVSILAIKASVITVEEILKDLELSNANNNCYELIGSKDFWNDVKTELLKL